DPHNCAESSRALADEGWFKKDPQSWAVGNMAEKLSGIIRNFLLGSATNLNAMAAQIQNQMNSCVGEYNVKTHYQQAEFNPLSGHINTLTWEAYEMLLRYCNGEVSSNDVKNAIDRAKSSIQSFSLLANKKGFSNVMLCLIKISASAGTMHSQIRYDPAIPKPNIADEIDTAGGHVVMDLIGLCAAETFLAHQQNPQNVQSSLLSKVGSLFQ
ncbi:MAG: hypothetical protein LBS71_00820, partial [Puniceicoccales bacterium]|nr:hypothetical protein [Puniceicoccales bacterium]